MNSKASVSLRRKSLFSQDAIAGGMAGGFARLITSPFDVLKIRYQLQSNEHPKYKSMISAFRTIVGEEGVLALWKGNLSATYLYVAYAMVQFSVYGAFKNILSSIPDPFHKETGEVKISDKLKISTPQWKAFMMFTAGALAGITATASTYPFDIMRTQFALQGKSKLYTSIPSFMLHTFHTQGVRGFYTGMGPALIGVAPYMGLNFAIYETLNGYFENVKSKTNSTSHLSGESMLLSSPVEGNALVSKLVSVMKSGAVGGLAGGASKFLVFPLDTVKRRLQSQVLKNTFEYGLVETTFPRYKGLINCVSTIWKYEGIRGFYKGILPTTAKSITATAITFASYEISKDFLRRLSEEERKSA